MKKFTAALSISAIALLVSLPAGSEADISVTLNGKALVFDDVPPQIIDGRTLVPLRAIFEALGADVDWNGETRTVTAQRDDTMISMTIGSNVMTINSRSVTLDVPPQIIDNRTLVPARAAAEGFGADVVWNESERTVIITTDNTSVSADSTKHSDDAAEPSSAPAEEPEEFPIEYNSEPESTVGYASRFRLISVRLNDEGNYDIEFELFTFLEGRGDVGVSFRCLDADGKEVDTFAGLYRGTDYTWSQQIDKATISGNTAVIELIPAGI
ncbi:MAG: copper amine oxidase N-terminal domain-containing protein [bacterium]|nr:copper amine oxidase N-terminal domain-containing protein [bacterium]